MVLLPHWGAALHAGCAGCLGVCGGGHGSRVVGWLARWVFGAGLSGLTAASISLHIYFLAHSFNLERW